MIISGNSKFLCFLFALLVSFCDFAYSLEIKDLESERVYQIKGGVDIENFRTILKGVTSKQELFDKFKDDPRFKNFFSQFVLIHTSDSSEKADVSFEKPRVIMHHDTIFMAYTGKEEGSFRETIPFFYFDQEAVTFLPAILSFTNSAPKLDTTPTTCVTCHGDPALPIWAEYNSWPEAYAGLGDGFRIGVGHEKEREHFYQFFTQGRKYFPYSFLSFPDPFFKFGEKVANLAKEDKKNFVTISKQNFQLGFHLYHLNAYRVVNIVQNSKLMCCQPELLKAAVDHCENIEKFDVPSSFQSMETVKSNILSEMIKYLKYRRDHFNAASIRFQQNGSPTLTYPWHYYKYVFQESNVDVSRWSLAFAPDQQLGFPSGYKDNPGAANEATYGVPGTGVSGIASYLTSKLVFPKEVASKTCNELLSMSIAKKGFQADSCL